VEPQAAMAVADNSNFIVHAFKVGGPAMYVIAAVGFLTIILILERFVTLRSLTVNKNDFNEHLFGMVLRGDIRQAITYCDTKPTPLTSTLKAGLVQVMNHRPDEEVQVAMDATVLRETPKVEGWASFLAVFGNVATLIGLVGTISRCRITNGRFAKDGAALARYLGSPSLYGVRSDCRDSRDHLLRVLPAPYQPNFERRCRELDELDEPRRSEPRQNKRLKETEEEATRGSG
jgi:hypothetical protein